MEILLYAVITLLILYGMYKLYEAYQKNRKVYYKYKEQETANKFVPETDYTYMPYRKANLLTKTEYTFFIVLVKEALKRRLLVCPKVRLEDIARVTTQKNRNKYRGYIKSRHVDFVLINPNTETIAAIELDDPSHNTVAAAKTDLFKDELFKTIGIPLIRIKTGTNYAAQINTAFDNLNIKQQELKRANNS